MPLSLWKGVGARGKDYQLFDRLALQYINMSCPEFYVHKYLGPTSTADNSPDLEGNELNISDLVNLEIRDRKYDTSVYALKGHTLASDTEFDLKQFGLFLSSDTKFITFHRNQMADVLGRRLMSGDVIEALFMRDTMTLDNRPMNQFYVVEDGVSPAEGYSPTWWPHLWRVKCQPLTDSEEFQQILQLSLEDRGDGIPTQFNDDGTVATLQQSASTYQRELDISDQVVKVATEAVPHRNFQTNQFYVYQPNPDLAASILTGSDVPPNGSRPVATGTGFPDPSKIGDYLLRIDYDPPVLYERTAASWKRIQTNWREPWSPANRVLETFINNSNTVKLNDGSVAQSRQGLRSVARPKLDPDI
jgi:hypothetical protein